MTDRELMQQALDALTTYDGTNGEGKRKRVLAALRERLAQPEQGPVAWMNPSWIDPDTRGWASDSFESIQIEGWIPLYTAPRRWQGLTGEEVAELTIEHAGYPVRLTGAIEAKLKGKNT